MIMGDWNTYYVCPNENKGCDYKEIAFCGDPFFIDKSVCPDCGHKIDKDRLTRHKNVKTLKFVSDSVWYKPNTWGNGHYQEK